MTGKRDNYQLQMQQAQRHFLTYDQQEMIHRCSLEVDEDYFYVRFLSEPYRICRKTGEMECFCAGTWEDGNQFGPVMSLLDWLCDSRPDRYTTGRFVNVVTQGHNFHRNLQEMQEDPTAKLFSAHPEAFRAACEALGGVQTRDADISYTIEILDGVRVLLKLWHPDEDFPAQLICLWEENVLQYIRYETTWYALGCLLQKLRELVKAKEEIR